MPVTERRAERDRPIRVLLVEDSSTDIELTREAFKDARVPNQLDVVTDGVQALSYLRRDGPHADAERPDIVLLDLNLPRKPGRDVLASMKVDPSLKTIPVIVMSSSAHAEDILDAYRHHVNAYIRKPVDFDEFTAVVRALGDFWASTVTLPPAE